VLLAGGIAVFVGGCGTGKTRMAYELAKLQRERTVSHLGLTKIQPCIYVTADRMMNLLRQNFGSDNDAKSEVNIQDELANSSLLVIDELDNGIRTDYGQRKLKSIVDERYQRRIPTILITNHDRNKLAELLPEPVRDRIRECGKGYYFNWPSFRGMATAS
jgi:DNA replication protein DnaC